MKTNKKTKTPARRNPVAHFADKVNKKGGFHSVARTKRNAIPRKQKHKGELASA